MLCLPVLKPLDKTTRYTTNLVTLAASRRGRGRWGFIPRHPQTGLLRIARTDEDLRSICEAQTVGGMNFGDFLKGEPGLVIQETLGNILEPSY